MEGNNEQTLLQLKEAGAIQLVPSKMPVYQNQNPEEPGTNLISILRLLIRNSASKEKDLQKITERDLLEACSQITEQKKDAKLPPHFIPPIRRFGNAELEEEDLNYLRLLRKDLRDSANPELVLKLIKQYHENNDSKFTESTWIRNLHIAMPTPTLQLINRTQLKNDVTLHTLWEDILHEFGSSRDNASIIASIYRVTKDSKHPLSMIKEIADLVAQGTDRVSELESVALYEIQRALNQMIGPAAASSIHVLFEIQPRKTVRSYYNMAYQNFYDLLNQPVKTETPTKSSTEEKIDDLIDTISNSTPTKSSTEEKIDALMHAISNSQAANYSCPTCGKPSDNLAANFTQARNTRTCQNCGKPGHLASQCRKPKPDCRSNNSNEGGKSGSQHSNRNSTSSTNGNLRPNQPNKSYKDSTCAIHPLGQHTNQQCKEQLTPCYFGENHERHQMADCRRTVALDQVFREPNFTSNAKRIFNGPNQNCDPGNPNPQAANTTDGLDTQNKAALIDLVAKNDKMDPQMKAAMIDFIARMK